MKKIANNKGIVLAAAVFCFSLFSLPVAEAGKGKDRYPERPAVHKTSVPVAGYGIAKKDEAKIGPVHTAVVVRPVIEVRKDSRHRQVVQKGHWEYKRVWVPAQYEKVWNPGHYNKRNRWVPGEWIRIEKHSGKWVKERVWVSGAHRRR